MTIKDAADTEFRHNMGQEEGEVPPEEVGSSMQIGKLIIIGSMIATLLSGCGYLSDDPVENTDLYNSGDLSVNCDLDPDQLAKILEKDVENQIKCLEANLRSFTKYVKRENRGSISERELGTFIERFFHKNSQMILDSMGLIFKLNMLFLNDAGTGISNDNIGPLFKLLIAANKEAVVITRLFKDVDEKKVDFWQARDIFNKSVSNLAKASLEIVRSKIKKGEIGTKIDLAELMSQIEGNFEDFEFDDKTIALFLKMKKVLVGGDANEMTTLELQNFLTKSPEVLTMAFDMWMVDLKNFDSELELNKFYIETASNAEKLVFDDGSNEVVFDQKHVADAIEKIFEAEKDKKFYLTVAEGAKMYLMDDHNDVFKDYTATHIRRGLRYMQIFFHATNLKMKLDELAAVISPDKNNKVNYTLEDIAKIKVQYLEQARYFRDTLKELTMDKQLFPLQIKGLEFAHIMNSAVDEEDKVDGKFITGIFQLKKLFVGGHIESFSINELHQILDKSETVVSLYHDFRFFEDKLYEGKDHLKYKLWLDGVKGFETLLFVGSAYTPMLELDDFINVAETLLKRDDVKSFREPLITIKPKLFGGYPHIYTLKDIQDVAAMGRDLLERLYFNDITYKLYEDLLRTTSPITGFPRYRHAPEYRIFDTKRVMELREDFFYQIKKYRHFQDDNGLQYYGNTIKRNRHGFVKSSMINWAIKKIAKVFGSKVDRRYQLTLDQVNNTLNSFKPILEQHGMWTKNPDTFARNTTLLSDLFQGNSNGSGTLDSDELTEYGNLALGAIEIGGRMVKKMVRYCYNVGTEENPKFDTRCARRNFLKVVFNDLKLHSHLPKLHGFYSTTPQADIIKYTDAIEGFARDYDDESLPYEERDLMLIMGAMLNIESTLIRFDSNLNNIIDRAELDRAFPVYKQAIITVGDLDEDSQKYTKDIFLLMIRDMKKPSTFDVVNYHYNPFVSGDISAKRLNIGMLLDFLVKNAK